MGAMGSDVAIETADVAPMGEDLRHLTLALSHAHRSRWIMLENIGVALAVITVLVPLAQLGVLGLAAVVAVHEVAGGTSGRSQHRATDRAARATDRARAAHHSSGCGSGCDRWNPRCGVHRAQAHWVLLQLRDATDSDGP